MKRVLIGSRPDVTRSTLQDVQRQLRELAVRIEAREPAIPATPPESWATPDERERYAEWCRTLDLHDSELIDAGALLRQAYVLGAFGHDRQADLVVHIVADLGWDDLRFVELIMHKWAPAHVPGMLDAELNPVDPDRRSLPRLLRAVASMGQHGEVVGSGSAQASQATTSDAEPVRVSQQQPTASKEIENMTVPVTLETAAKWFRMDRKKLRKQIKAGRIRCEKFGRGANRFDLDQVTQMNPAVRKDADPAEQTQAKQSDRGR